MGYRDELVITPSRRGLEEITPAVEQRLAVLGVQDGLVHVFLCHTSASLIVQENADPDVLRDLEDWLDRAVPDGDPAYRHRAEGPDDMPAHIKGAITATELTLPMAVGQLCLGTWQGIFLWEHRNQPRPRRLVLSVVPFA